MRSVALALLVLVPACNLYFRDDEQIGDDDVPPPVDGGGLPDADVTDAAVPPDAVIPVDPPNPGFVTPTSTTRANQFRNGQWTEVGAADWSCLNQAPNEPVPMTGYTLTGTVRDYANNQSVGGVQIVATTLDDVALAAATSSGGAGTRGQYRLDIPALPANTSRVRFILAATGPRKTILMDRYLGQFGITTLDLPLLSNTTASMLPALVGETPEDSDGLIVGELRDCQGRHVSGAIVALSTSSQFVAHWPESETFYFSIGQTSLPVRHDVRTETHRDGRFMVIHADRLAALEGTLQAWGFMTEADRSSGTLRLLGKSPAIVDATVVSHALIGRNRSGIGTGN